MPVHGIVIKGDLSIEGNHFVVLGDNQWVDLGHRAIKFDEQFAKLTHEHLSAFCSGTADVQLLA